MPKDEQTLRERIAEILGWTPEFLAGLKDVHVGCICDMRPAAADAYDEKLDRIMDAFHKVEVEFFFLGQHNGIDRICHRQSYKQGHIDHQLVLEASTDVMVADLKELSDSRAGGDTDYTFDADEILARAREEGAQAVVEAIKKCVEKLMEEKPHSIKS